MAKRGEGDCDRFDVSLSRRIVPSDVRLRFAICREDRPLRTDNSELSEGSGLSDGPCRRLVVAGRMFGWVGAAPIEPEELWWDIWEVCWAEMSAGDEGRG